MPKTRKTEKLSITLPEELVTELRMLAPHGKLSAFIAEAAEFYLAYHRQKAALKIGFGAWKARNHPELKTPEDSTSYICALREADEWRLTCLRDKSGT